MEDLLPLLFVLVAVGISALKSLNKKMKTAEEAEPPFSPQTFPPAPWEEPLEKPMRSSVATERRAAHAPRSKEVTHAEKRKDSSLGRSAKRPQKTTPVASVPQTDERGYALDSAEEVRRAIIYSEIMNRKY